MGWGGVGVSCLLNKVVGLHPWASWCGLLLLLLLLLLVVVVVLRGQGGGGVQM
jgi:hypothetical protein